MNVPAMNAIMKTVDQKFRLGEVVLLVRFENQSPDDGKMITHQHFAFFPSIDYV